MPNEAPTTESADVDFAALLRSEQAELKAQLKELGFANEGDTGLSYDSNFADSSQVTAERGEAERLGAGSYGVCQVCGKPIGAARLEAMPAARFCIVDAAKH